MKRLISALLSLALLISCFSGMNFMARAAENVYGKADSENGANATEPTCIDTECTETETGEEILATEAIADNTAPAVAVKAAAKSVPAGLSYSVSSGEVTITDYTGSAAELVIPDTINGYPVTSIGEDAFYNCRKLTSVTIPDSVTSIGNDAFYYCSSLTSITIPDSVTSIGEDAFCWCSSLTAVYITDVAAWCGITFGDSIANPLYYAKNLYLNGKMVTDLVIPDSVTSIGSYAFCNCDSLTSITIPDSVTNIGYGAFKNCSSLTGIWVDENNTSYCSDTYGVLYDQNKTTLIQAPAKGNVGAYVIPDSVTSIGSEAFYNCSSLTSITIPDSVTSIGYQAFYDCSSLNGITIPDSVTSIGDCAFYGCSSLQYNIYDNAKYLGNSDNPYIVLVKSIDYTITTCDIHIKTKFIHSYAFYNCTRLTSITIPDSVTSIGDHAFYYCTSMTSVTIGDSVTSIGNRAFYNCTSLTSVTIGNGVTSIGDHAFYKCSSLTSITIGDSVASIGDHAFYYCTSLTSITIPDSVTSIGSWAFSNCSSLTSITIPDSVTSIGSYAFSSCSSLTSITIGDGVTSIGDDAFSGCSSLTGVCISDIAAWCAIDFESDYANPLRYAKNLYLNGSLLTDLVIPDSVASIGSHAFGYCTSLTSVTIGNSVTSIGDHAFAGCIITKLIFAEGAKAVKPEMVVCKSTLQEVVIPDSVTSIGDDAFYQCNSLTGVYFSDIAAWCAINFESGYANPLYYANNLYLNGNLVTNLVIPDSVTSIGDLAFLDCDSLSSVTIPDSVTSIGDHAFQACVNLSSVTIGNGVTSIGDYAFQQCDNLTGITIPDSVTNIGNDAFQACDNLSSVTIGNGVTSIGDYAFGGCDSLTSITIPDSVTSIGKYAFYYSANLTRITIGNGITNVKYCAFSGCSSLNHVIYTGTQEQWQSVTIGDSNSALTGAKVFHYGGGEVYWTKNCVNAGLYCTACDDFLTREREDDGTHAFTDDADLACNDCSFVRSIKAVSIYQLPTQLEYTHCKDTLDVSGGVLLLTYSGGVSIKMDMTPDMVSGFDNTVPGTQVLTVTVEGIKTSYRVTIVLGEPESLTVDRLPDKLIYISGESLDLTGLSATAHYTNNYTEVLSLSDLTVSSVDMSSSGVKSVTVSYDGVSASFDVYVHSRVSYTVDSSLYPESSHNYASNTDETKIFTHPYAEQLVLTFDSSSYTESTYDLLYVLDGEGNQIGKYSGSLAEKVVTVPGDTVQLRLVSDSSVNKYGYAFTSIVATVIEYTRQEVSGYAPTLFAPGLTDGVICQCCGTVIEAQQEIPKLEGSVAQWNLSMEDDWKVNFHLQISDSIVPSAQVHILLGENDQSFNVSNLQKIEDGYYLASVGIAAAQMNDAISVQVINGEDCGEVYTYTVRQYCDTILADSSQSQYHALIKEMLNYGAMAQVYFGYDAENLANDGITGTAATEVPETAEEMTVSDKISSLNFYGASLVYRDRIAVRYYFTGDVTGCTFTANGNTYIPVAKDGMHYIEIADILPQNLDQQITLTVTDAAGNTLSVTYGPMNYIVRMNAKGSENLKNLLKALYNYHLAAKAL